MNFDRDSCVEGGGEKENCDIPVWVFGKITLKKWRRNGMRRGVWASADCADREREGEKRAYIEKLKQPTLPKSLWILKVPLWQSKGGKREMKAERNCASEK